MDMLLKLYRIVVFKTLLLEMVEQETVQKVSYVCKTHETVQEVSSDNYNYILYFCLNVSPIFV